MVTSKKATRIYPGNDKPSVDQLDLKVEDGGFLVLAGPFGCGKSISLRIFVDLKGVSGGHISIGDEDATDVPPENRDVTMVFQNYAFYPYMTVCENMGFALKIAGTPKEEIAKCVEGAVRILDLEPYLNRKPKALSGGQRQHVAIGHAIVRKPQVFLMGEPLSNLDVKLCVQTRTQIVSLQRQLGVTIVHVTHDQTEVLIMDDRIMTLKDGLLQQVGSSQEMHKCSVNKFVVGSIGSPVMNLGKFKVEGSTAILDPARIPLSAAMVNALTAGDRGMITIRFCLEGLEFASETEADPIPIQADFTEELSPDTFVYGYPVGTGGQGIGSTEKGSSEQLIVCMLPRTAPAHGGIVYTHIIADQQYSSLASTGIYLPE